MINLMDVITEEINMEIPMIKMNNQDEVLLLKESVKFLEQERNSQKKEIKTLNETLEELQKKDNAKENMILELKNIIEANKIEFQKKLEDKMQEFENKIEEKENSLKNKIEENKTEIQNKMEEKDNLYNNKIKEIQEEREKIENEIITSVSKHQEEIQGLQLTEKYVKDKLILDEKENEKEIEKHIYKRVLDNFNMEIYMILYEKKIKFNIKEIQDDLKSNLLIYETNFTIEKLSEKTVHFKNLGNIESIFKFLHDLLNDKKDKIKKKKIKLL